MKDFRCWISIGSVCWLASCTLYPKYSRPEMAVPAEWRIPTEEAADVSNVCWWKQFGDPVLDHYVDEALANNQDLKTAIYRVEEFVAKLGIARSYLYPQLSGSAAAGRDKLSTTLQPIQPGVDAISDSYTLLMNASYQLDIWGKIRSATDVALANLMAQIEARRTVVLTLVSSVARTYIQIRELDQELLVSQETLKTRVVSYDLAKTRYELGLTSEMQVQQSLSEVESAQVELDRIRIAIALQEDLLCVLLGKPPTYVERGKILAEILQPPSVPVALPSQVIGQRPDILQAEQNLIAANAKIGIARAEFFPQISLTGTYGVEGSEWNSLFTKPSTVWAYAANLLQEIFTGGRLTSNLKLTKAQKLSLLHEYENTILNAFQEVNDALISHKISLEIVKEQKERVNTLAEYLRLATLRYDDGLTDYLTVLDAERQLFEAQLYYAKSQGEVFFTLIDIYKSLGGGWVVDADTYSDRLEIQK